MLQAGVTTLEKNLVEYLRRVQRGEKVIVTASGRPVAALVGLEELMGPENDDTQLELAEAVAEGRLTKPLGLADPPRIPGRHAEEAVIEDRR